MGAFKVLENTITFAGEEQNKYILLDNHAAVLALQTRKAASSMRIIWKFQELARNVHATVKWVSAIETSNSKCDE